MNPATAKAEEKGNLKKKRMNILPELKLICIWAATHISVNKETSYFFLMQMKSTKSDLRDSYTSKFLVVAEM